ncbi:DUF4956 domain-containing protein [Clostridium aminobutyricum]|uniref:DUF4956 domain-containing protein n=1 Tax=Clostridium aminobutyricum TaxID=33953 RepID=A0A939D9I9_CLOAM|nr:DUF4956 domain-containing protein [Clostridium aminobutyricum]MBN7773899.1 DUF4956 domain-containing protein [Clostridium aminobutyricum]
MLNSLTESLTNAATSTDATTAGVIVAMCTALGLGMMIALCYLATNKTALNRRGFALTLIMLPAILSVIILFIGGNVARAFSLAGTLSIIRFRSAPGDAKDIGYIFFATAAGLACGVGMYAGGAAFVIVMSLIMFLLEKLNFGGSGTAKSLKVTIPENLNYEDAFKDVLEKYTSHYKLNRIRTTDLGSLFEANYQVTLKPEFTEKDFIDDLRVKNGNLSIVLTMQSE